MAPRTRNRKVSTTETSQNPSQSSNHPEDTRAAKAANRSQAPSTKRPPPRVAPPSKRTRKDPAAPPVTTNDASDLDDNYGDEQTNDQTEAGATSNRAQDETPQSQSTRVPEAKITPTLDNYQSLIKHWPTGRILKVLKANKASTHNRAPSEVQTRVKLIYNLFKQELLMLAMIGGVSESTIESYIPEWGSPTSKAPSGYTLFLEYDLKCLAERMPIKGNEDAKVVVAQRNRKNGARWRTLPEDEKIIYTPEIFYALAGVPNPLVSLDEEEESDEDDAGCGDSFVPVPTVHKLSIEEDELYRPVYERLVDLKKVSSSLGMPSKGPGVAQIQRKSKSAIEKFAYQLSCAANRLDFAYYLVATSTATPNNSTEMGWLKEYTTHPQVAIWANKTSGLATVFATYSQGESMAKAIATAVGKPKRVRNDKQQPSDKIKVDLGRLLAALTTKTLGYLPNQSFPQTADPVAELKRRSLPISIVLVEGAKLNDEKLSVGFKKMRSATRLEWVQDIKDGKFRLLKLEVGSEEAIGEPVALEGKEIEVALVTPSREVDKVVLLEADKNVEEEDADETTVGNKKDTIDNSDTNSDSSESNADD